MVSPFCYFSRDRGYFVLVTAKFNRQFIQYPQHPGNKNGYLTAVLIEFPWEMCSTRQTLPSIIFFLAGQIEKNTIQGLYQCSPSRLQDSVKECLSKDGYLNRQVKSNIHPFGKI